MKTHLGVTDKADMREVDDERLMALLEQSLMLQLRHFRKIMVVLLMAKSLHT